MSIRKSLLMLNNNLDPDKPQNLSGSFFMKLLSTTIHLYMCRCFPNIAKTSNDSDFLIPL